MTLMQKNQLEMIIEEINVSENQEMWKIGDEVEFFFLIKQGAFILHDCGEYNSEPLRSGVFIGDTNKMINNQTHITCVRALSDSTIYIISKLQFKDFLMNNPGIMFQIMDFKYFD